MTTTNNNFDIINLIENNPITKINSNYNSKLIEKIRNKFTEYEQQFFIASFYTYLKYDYIKDFVVDLDDIWLWIGYNQKVKAKSLLERFFILNIDYIIIDDSKQIKTHGGNNKEKIMLNIRTFKLFCIKAGTKRADEIHEYFIKLEEILQETIKEENEELKEHLQIQLEIKNNELNEVKTNAIKEREQDKHKYLLREFNSSGPLVYIIKVKIFENKDYIIKIGESRKGISLRYNEHKNKYEQAIILDCFSVLKSKDFESFIHNELKDYRVTNLENHETERELFLINKNLSYDKVLSIIDNNIKYYNGDNQYEIEQLKIENERLKLNYDKLKFEYDKLLDSINNNTVINKISSNDIDTSFILDKLDNITTIPINKLEQIEKTNKEILNKLNSLQTKTTNNFNEPLTTLGPRLQKFNPDNLELIRVYESVSECIKENPKLKRPSISNAVKENTIYQGFRWQLIDRELDPYSITNIEPTKQTIIKNTGYIAKINSTKTEIVNVYIDRKTAALQNGHSSASALDTPFAKGTISNGHYYMLYEKSDENLIEDFEEKNGIPLLYKCGIGKYNENQELVEEFDCKQSCYKNAGISDKSLAKALDNGIMYNGFYYKYLGEKLSML